MPVVIVSHQLDRVLQMCTTALLLKKGEVMRVGRPQDVIAEYFTGNAASNEGDELTVDAPYRVLEARIGAPHVGSGEFLDVTMICERIPGRPIRGDESVGIALVSLAGASNVAAFGSRNVPLQLPTDGTFRLDMRVQANVAPGPYSIDSWVWATHDATYRGPRLALEVTPTLVFDGSVQLNPSMTLTPLDVSAGNGLSATGDLDQKAS